MTEQPCCRNRAVIDRGFDPRLHPYRLRMTRHDDWWSIDFDRLEPLPTLAALLHAPARGHFADICELAPFLARQMERSDETGALRGVTDNREGLAHDALHLDPALGAAGSI